MPLRCVDHLKLSPPTPRPLLLYAPPPCRYFQQDDTTLLEHYLTESSGATKHGTKRLAIVPPPPTDADVVLQKIRDILVQTHTRFFQKFVIPLVFMLQNPR